MKLQTYGSKVKPGTNLLVCCAAYYGRTSDPRVRLSRALQILRLRVSQVSLNWKISIFYE